VATDVDGGGEDRIGWGGCGIGKGDNDGGGGKGLSAAMLVFGRGGMVKVFVDASELREVRGKDEIGVCNRFVAILVNCKFVSLLGDDISFLMSKV
jgi:hypothetical protein